jgi:hypothetical protein
MTTRDNTDRSSGASASTLLTAAVDGHPDLGRTGDASDRVDAGSAQADVKHRAREVAVAVTHRAKDTAGSLGHTVRQKPAPAAAVLAGLAATVGAAGALRRRRAARAPQTRLRRLLAKLPHRH